MPHDSTSDLAELRAAHAALADELWRTRSRYEALLRTDTQFLWGTDATGLVTDMPEWRAFTGQTLEEVRGQGWAEAVHPDDRARAAATWAEAVATRRIYDTEYRARHHAGGYRWLRLRGVPVLDADGTLREWVGVASDVTAQKEAFASLEQQNARIEAEVAARTEELRLSEARRERFWNLSLDLLDVVDAEGRFKEVNPAWTRLLGWTEEELKAQPFLAWLHPDDVAPTLAELAKLDEGVTTLHFENRFKTRSGEFRHIEWTAQPEGGLFYAYGRDVTGRKAAESAIAERTAQLEEARAQLQGVLDSSASGIMGCEAVRDAAGRIEDFRFTLVNPMAAEIVDRPAETLVGDRLLNVFPGVREEGLFDAYARVAELGQPFETEIYYRHEGLDFWLDITAVKLGRGIAITFTDISARKRDEQALQHSYAQVKAQAEALARERNFARSLIENVPSGIAYLDKDLVYRVSNPVYSAFLQMAPADIVDRPLFDVVPGGEDQIGPLLRGVMETGIPHYAHEFPFNYRGPDGQMRETYWDFVYYPTTLADGQSVDGVLVLADEVSERVEREREQRRLQGERDTAQRERIEALEQADKLKDEFLSILSHELRTPINAIMGFGSVLDDELVGALTPAQHDYMGKILASADVLLALIDDLLVLSRVRAGKFRIDPEPTAVEAVVRQTVDALGPTLGKQSKTVTVSAEAGLPLVQADPQRLAQVVNNLVGNAAKFSREGGTIRVALSRTDGHVRVAVSDQGIGIAEADLPKLFKRFGQVDTSATRNHKGTGLGLSIVKAIVEAHGGTVGVESTFGAGSTFWFTLPVTG